MIEVVIGGVETELVEKYKRKKWEGNKYNRTNKKAKVKILRREE